MNTATLHSLRATDVSRQKSMQLSDVALDLSIGEIVDTLVASMQLPRFDRAGRPLDYQARSENQGRALHRSERVSALKEDDQISLLPSVDAGGGL
ncbi:MAG: hypothetical protein ABMA13_02320 [Chthoniobacteraceae bacterium]